MSSDDAARGTGHAYARARLVDGRHGMQAKVHTTTTCARKCHTMLVVAGVQHIRVGAPKTLPRPPPARVEADEGAGLEPIGAGT